MELPEEVWNDLYNYYYEDCENDEREEVWYLYRRLVKTYWQYEDIYCQKHAHPKTKEKSKYPCILFTGEKKFMNSFLLQFPDLASMIGDLNEAKKEWKNAEKRMKRSGCIFFDYQTREYFLTQSIWSDQWGIPQGKINKYETNRQCAVREMREEIGYDIDASPSVPYCIVRYKKDNRDWMYYVLFCNKHRMRFHLNRNEVRRFTWETFQQMKSFEKKHPDNYEYLREFFCFFDKFENEVLKEKIKPKKVIHFTKHSDEKLREFTIIEDRLEEGTNICMETSKTEARREIVNNSDNKTTFGPDLEKNLPYSVAEIFQKSAIIENRPMMEYDGNADAFGDPQPARPEERLVIKAKPYFDTPSSLPSRPFGFDYDHLRDVYMISHLLVC